MTRYAAFLRAINVGGHTVKMDHLRLLFQSLDLSEVETFIASGNVVFETQASDARGLEQRIEAALGQALGFDVTTFIRTDAEVARIAAIKPFPQRDLDSAGAFNVAFLAGVLDQPAQRKLASLKTDLDDFHVAGREIYWLCRKKQSESTFSNAVLEKALGQPATLRGMSTIRRMDAKYRFSGK